MSGDPLRPPLEAALYAFLYVVVQFILGNVLYLLGGYVIGLTLGGLFAALIANLLCTRIFDAEPLTIVGLTPNAPGARNALTGFALGAGAVILVLTPALFTGAASIVPGHDPAYSWRATAWALPLLACGAAGEEILFHGFGFQSLAAYFGRAFSVLLVGIIFGLLHTANPHSTPLGIVNTTAFGLLFGYAFLRSHDLWLPMGLHAGWNLALPLFGTPLSGLTIKVTSYELHWKSSALWSGGEYGPEGGVLASAALVVLCAGVAWVPVKRGRSLLELRTAEAAARAALPALPPS